MQRQSFWSGLVVIGFALLALYWIIPEYAGMNPQAQMPPELVPNIASWIMLISGVIIVLRSAVGMARTGQMPLTREINWPALSWAAWPFLYVGAAIVVLDNFGLIGLGHLNILGRGDVKLTFAGVPMIMGMLYLLGERRWHILLGCSVVPALLLYGLSVHLMRVGFI